MTNDRKRKLLSEVLDLAELNGVEAERDNDLALELCGIAAYHYNGLSELAEETDYIVPKHLANQPEEVCGVCSVISAMYYLEERLQGLIESWGDGEAGEYDFLPEIFSATMETFKKRYMELKKEKTSE